MHRPVTDHTTASGDDLLVGTLFDGPLDIVGDVHGEIEALDDLLQHLGYANDGSHPDHRRLVFLGDLVDRGPDSPAVLRRVKRLVEAGRAQCIIGNHELNLLRDDAKRGNEWWTTPDKDTAHPQAVASPEFRAAMLPFLQSLPLALERDDLRVVHASWHQPSIDTLRKFQGPGVGAANLYEHFLRATSQKMAENKTLSYVKREWMEIRPRLDDPDWDAVLLPIKASLDEYNQMGNPVAVCTSGQEHAAKEPFWAGGKWRMVSRTKWWERYDDDVPVVIGHYWRRFAEAGVIMGGKHGPDLFEGIEPHHWMGRKRNVYCVDFSVGARPGLRAAGQPVAHCTLAAVRVPEWQVMHDDGSTFAIT